MDWYRIEPDDSRRTRAPRAIDRAGIEALLALTPENAAYLAGRSSYIASLWRVPGLLATALGAGGRLAVALPDADLASFPASLFGARFPHRLWVEHAALQDDPGIKDIAAHLGRLRPGGPQPRPAQFDLDEVFRNAAEAVCAVAAAPKRIGVDLETVPAASVARLQSELPGVELIDATRIFADLRAVKDPDEIEHLRRAAELTVLGIAAARERLVQGMPEQAVNAAYQCAIWERVAADPRYVGTRQVEGVATVGNAPGGDRTVGPGKTVKFDMQVDVNGYHSDIGRTYALAPTPSQMRVYVALHESLLAAQAATTPGATFAQVFAAGSAAMHAAGFDTYSRGHLGHSVGLGHNYEEAPFIAPDEHRAMVAGMVLSLELPLYLHGLGHFQLERMLLLTPTGHEILDDLPFDFAIDMPRYPAS